MYVFKRASRQQLSFWFLSQWGLSYISLSWVNTTDQSKIRIGLFFKYDMRASLAFIKQTAVLIIYKISLKRLDLFPRVLIFYTRFNSNKKNFKIFYWFILFIQYNYMSNILIVIAFPLLFSSQGEGGVKMAELYLHLLSTIRPHLWCYTKRFFTMLFQMTT